MELSKDQTDSVSLAALAADAGVRLRAGQYDWLASSYGYALAYDRPIPDAIQQELQASLDELGATSLVKSDLPPRTSVAYFKPGESFLFAVATCELPTDASGSVQLELIVTIRDDRTYLCIEGISAQF
ncbi:hypothetical protein [Oleiagrimonas sp. MCCC 1A03011]|jgi:hypothetical protein|uniref:hypothetical protein n=1 Tax=Oleiagrimonas sp. MCCC 1A03011 TaxID=1926883 RepID=UPI0011BEDEA7|nr:hypothetical protein [Oleiagrimonas sp. MCCC 1A03011]